MILFLFLMAGAMIVGLTIGESFHAKSGIDNEKYIMGRVLMCKWCTTSEFYTEPAPFNFVHIPVMAGLMAGAVYVLRQDIQVSNKKGVVEKV